MAVYLLHRTDTPIHQIAINVGFSEPSAFNRAFKKWTGMTPGDYRITLGCVDEINAMRLPEELYDGKSL